MDDERDGDERYEKSIKSEMEEYDIKDPKQLMSSMKIKIKNIVKNNKLDFSSPSN